MKEKKVQIYGKFEFLRDTAGAIIGAEVTGDGSTESKLYCMAFPGALSSGEASIGCNGGKIYFNLLRSGATGTCVFERPEEEVAVLKAIISQGKPLEVEASSAWCGGFTVTLARRGS